MQTSGLGTPGAAQEEKEVVQEEEDLICAWFCASSRLEWVRTVSRTNRFWTRTNYQ